jgi:uncharacterized membrane protein YqjE
MTTEDIYFYFVVWLIIAVVLVIAAAALLITVIWYANRIRKLAAVALDVVVDIEKNTKSIWQLNATYSVSSQLLGGAKAIEDNAVAILGALSKNDKK